MWNSSVDIANGALSLLGEQRITSLSDTTERAVLCNLYYDQARREVLSAAPWPFSLGRAVLTSTLSSAPAHSYANAFQLPSDLLRLWRVSDVDEQDQEKDSLMRWAREGDTVLADVDAVYIVYGKDETDVVKFDPQFIRALRYRLAADIAKAITESATDVEQLENQYEKALMDARHLASLEAGFARVDDNYLYRYRY